jgi:hypothetical protein
VDESLAGFRLSGKVRGKKLERDGAVEAGVLGFIHNTHPSFAKLLQDVIVRCGRPDHKDLLWWESGLTVTAGNSTSQSYCSFD